jgi:hypothetical protein
MTGDAARHHAGSGCTGPVIISSTAHEWCARPSTCAGSTTQVNSTSDTDAGGAPPPGPLR